jgi:protein gp37
MQKKYKNGKLISRGIEWTDATWNPIAGCQHGCRWKMPDGSIAICYAEHVAEGVAKHAYEQGFEHHYWKPKHLDSPKKKKTPLKIFVGSMADLFGHWVLAEQIEAVLSVARECPEHIFQLLTKNPVRTKDFDMPSNVWVGTSSPPDFMWGKQLSTVQRERMLHRMLESLSQAEATVKWMSIEPLSWNVAPILKQYPDILNWAVIGAASNGSTLYAPKAEDFFEVQSVLDSQNVAIFFKGNMTSLTEAKARWREEFPILSTENTKKIAL